LKYFSMFSGIGGFEIGIQRACYQSANAESQQAEPEETVSVRVGETVQEVSRRGRRFGDTDENERDILLRRTEWLRNVCIGYSEIDKYAIQIY